MLQLYRGLLQPYGGSGRHIGVQEVIFEAQRAQGVKCGAQGVKCWACGAFLEAWGAILGTWGAILGIQGPIG